MTSKDKTTVKSHEREFVRWDDIDPQDQATIVQQLIRELAHARGQEAGDSHPYVSAPPGAKILEVEFNNDLIEASPQKFALYMKRVVIGSKEPSSVILLHPGEVPTLGEAPGKFTA